MAKAKQAVKSEVMTAASSLWHPLWSVFRRLQISWMQASLKKIIDVKKEAGNTEEDTKRKKNSDVSFQKGKYPFLA